MARDVGLGGKTPDLWVVGNVAASNGYGVYRCVNGAWAAVAGAAISADVNGVPVLVNAAGEIYRGWK